LFARVAVSHIRITVRCRSMGKQHAKVEKKRRRINYIKRKKAAAAKTKA
jgi:hypothetical protein